MSTIQSLSKEVLILIFTSLDSVESIGECRLVCKRWNNPAAIAMFQRPLHLCFYDRIKAEKLIQYLKANQTIGQHVRYLSLCDYNNSILEAVLPLLFTPNIRELGGDGIKDVLYQLIAKIAKESTAKFEKLNVIPSSYHFTDSYAAALWTFRKSLTDVNITLQEVPDSPLHLANRLHTFKRLTMLTLNAPFGDHLKKIAYDTPMDDTATASSLACQFDDSSVQRVKSLNTLNIFSAGYPHFVSYLMFKYPNMQRISIHIYEADADITERIQDLIQSLKKLTHYYVKYKIAAKDAVTTPIFDAAQNDINIVSIGYHYDSSDASTIDMMIEGRQIQGLNHQTFFSMHIPPNASTITHAWHLSQIRIPINSLEVDIFNCRDCDMNDTRADLRRRIPVDDEVVVFFDVLLDNPNIENIRFIARDISDCTKSHFFQHHTWLKSLEICCAQLSADTFVALSDVCRGLCALRLVNCPILPKGGIVRINMKHNAFQQLTYQLTLCNFFTCDMDASDNNAAIDYAEKVLRALELHYTQDTYLWLRTRKMKRSMFLKLRPGDTYRYLINKKQFSSRPPEARAIQISCFSIEHLLLDLDAIQLQIDKDYIEFALTSRLSSGYHCFEKSDSNH
ncbi:hypothetical protein V8B55DRAFT_1601469 [Mucor lusitanicus]